MNSQKDLVPVRGDRQVKGMLYPLRSLLPDLNIVCEVLIFVLGDLY